MYDKVEEATVAVLSRCLSRLLGACHKALSLIPKTSHVAKKELTTPECCPSPQQVSKMYSKVKN